MPILYATSNNVWCFVLRAKNECCRPFQVKMSAKTEAVNHLKFRYTFLASITGTNNWGNLGSSRHPSNGPCRVRRDSNHISSHRTEVPENTLEVACKTEEYDNSPYTLFSAGSRCRCSFFWFLLTLRWREGLSIRPLKHTFQRNLLLQRDRVRLQCDRRAQICSTGSAFSQKRCSTHSRSSFDENWWNLAIFVRGNTSVFCIKSVHLVILYVLVSCCVLAITILDDIWSSNKNSSSNDNPSKTIATSNFEQRKYRNRS